MGPKYSKLSIFAKFFLVSISRMSQLQFLGGCLTRRYEISITLQSPVEVVLCIIFDVMIYLLGEQIDSVCLWCNHQHISMANRAYLFQHLKNKTN